MTPDTLARELAAHPRWTAAHWRAGMLVDWSLDEGEHDHDACGVIRLLADAVEADPGDGGVYEPNADAVLLAAHQHRTFGLPRGCCWPILDDAGTVGILAAIGRDLWGPSTFAYPRTGPTEIVVWEIVAPSLAGPGIGGRRPVGAGDLEGEAWARAILRAFRRTMVAAPTVYPPLAVVR